jgi:hypothetical protein
MICNAACKQVENRVYSRLFADVEPHANRSEFRGVEECFANLRDPCVEGRTLRRLSDVLFLTVCGVMCGMDDEEAIEE